METKMLNEGDTGYLLQEFKHKKINVIMNIKSIY